MRPKKSRLIEQLAISRIGRDLFATGELSGRVTVWSLSERSRLSAFETILDLGGDRLAISTKEAIVAAGSWTVGISAYDYSNGGLIWSRPDLKNVQRVSAFENVDGVRFGVNTEKNAFHLLDGATGNSILNIRGLTKVFASRYSEFYLLVSRRHLQLTNGCGGICIWKRDLESFAVLDVAFSDTRVAYSEAAGRVRCCDFFGEEIWTVRLPSGQHVRALTWNADRRSWLALGHDYEKNENFHLLEIDGDGSHHIIAPVEAGADGKFSALGDYLITTAGAVYDAASARIIWQFA